MKQQKLIKVQWKLIQEQLNIAKYINMKTLMKKKEKKLNSFQIVFSVTNMIKNKLSNKIQMIRWKSKLQKMMMIWKWRKIKIISKMISTMITNPIKKSK